MLTVQKKNQFLTQPFHKTVLKSVMKKESTQLHLVSYKFVSSRAMLLTTS